MLQLLVKAELSVTADRQMDEIICILFFHAHGTWTVYISIPPSLHPSIPPSSCQLLQKSQHRNDLSSYAKKEKAPFEKHERDFSGRP